MSAKVDQQLLLDRILDRLNQDGRVDAAQVNVEISPRGSVTLRGSVPDFDARDAAEAIARSEEGVRDVYDYLVVPLPEGTGAPAPEGDEAMVARVNGMLSEQGVFASERIVTRVEDGVAVLEGSVNAFWKKNRAGEVALATEGIREVVNLLAVVPTRLRDDEEIAARIMDALANNFFIDPQRVDVKVNRALVTLQGTVPTAKARREAFQAALYEEGVVDVRDELRIAPSAE
jgi:osmotically-inducible protein OsmY